MTITPQGRTIYSRGFTMSEERIPRNEIVEERRRFIRSRMLLTVKDAALILACGERTVERLMEEGKLAKIKNRVSGSIKKTTAESLDDYIQSLIELGE